MLLLPEDVHVVLAGLHLYDRKLAFLSSVIWCRLDIGLGVAEFVL